MSHRKRRRIDPKNLLQRHGPTQDMVKRMGEAAERLHRAGARILLELDVNHAIALVAMLQLATRHPGAHGPTARQAQEVIEWVIHSLEQAEPYLGTVLRMGNTTRYDVQG